MSPSPYNTSNNTVNQLPPLQESSATDTIVFLLFCLSLSIVIIAGNGLIVLAYRTNTRLRNKANTFLVSLAVSDILVGIVSLPCWVVVQLLGVSGVFYIIFIGFDIFSGLTSVLHLTAISIERFIAISKPFLYPTLSSIYYKCTLSIAWASAALLAGLYIVLQLYGMQKNYVPAVLLIGFLGPLFIICSMYCRIFIIAKSLIQKEPTVKEAEELSQAEKPRKKNAVKKEHKVAVTVLIITGLFFAAWLPHYVLLTLGATCWPGCFPSSGKDVARIVAFSKWMHYGNSAVNVFVYSFRDLEMRRTFARLLYNRLTRICIRLNTDVDDYGFSTV
ncbi:D(1B) dopamine receptor [Exaiptasia diaphana]|uniref:G-protein coupled receptors family 1 profile domain-containing protein n=1 Tax=Exaiptasia diaphana TaxID=2652724 RepID=A0A913YM01_EXADI|nr:D(1B) dopamine receptor [Exaiptasia diaphana]XP_028515289.1 D(1B) dopamine receptor [Exaiptasia diaphana]XP_028515290.1 D(1B) dopamine receptor [Exaiptasia diaphana]XP_028515291.1 D(1B) dopamine receptor [Exaiptasia diaphana]